MTRRDILWRSGGAVLILTGYAATGAAIDAVPRADLIGLSGLAVAGAGLLLLLGGRKVAAALRVERSRHRDLPGAIRRARRGQSTDR